MNNKDNKIKEKFDSLFSKWESIIQRPEIQFSSRPQDYIDNEPYREIIKLGKETLPLLIDKLEKGVFFFNQAVVEISGGKMDDIIGKENLFLSEQEKSKLILEWWKSKREI